MSGESHLLSPVCYYTVTDDHAGQRLDNFLHSYLTGVPKGKLYSIIRKGEVRVNKGRIQAQYRLALGDIVRIPPIRQEAKTTQNATLPGHRLIKLLEESILYEDDALLVLNKPEKIAVHGGSGVQFGIIEAMRHSRPHARFLELVHRLDRDTSGCVMIAKKRSMLVHLHECLRLGNIEKRYYCLVSGAWRGNKAVEAPLKKYLLNDERMVKISPEGKFARTQFEIVESFSEATLLQAIPITGRTHQIRVHCAYMGHPVWGDQKYGGKMVLKDQNPTRLFLHAHRLIINLPEKSNPLVLTAPLPPAFDEMCAKFRT